MAMTISSMVNSGWNFSSFFNTGSTNRNAAQQSISNMWNAYSSSQRNATSEAANLQEVRANAAALVSSYDEAKTEFYNEFDGQMNNLATSAKAVKNFDFESVTQAFSAASKVVQAATEAADKANVAQEQASGETAAEVNTGTSAAAKVIEQAAEAAKKTEPENKNQPPFIKTDFGMTIANTGSNGTITNDDGSVTTITAEGSRITSIGNGAITKTETYDSAGNMKTTTEYSKIMQSALKTVQDFVDNYNSSLEFFQDNSAVSSRVGRMAELFGDTQYRAQSYAEIGINVGNDGSLSINEEKLAQAIVDNPNRVSSTIGGTGLADKAEQHINVANSQRSQLFPSAQSMFGNELSTASFYTSGAYINMSAANNLGNLVNMMF